jgi:hypothetical protein
METLLDEFSFGPIASYLPALDAMTTTLGAA